MSVLWICDDRLKPVFEMSQHLMTLLEQEAWDDLELKQVEFSTALMKLPIVEIAKDSPQDLKCLQTIVQNNDTILAKSIERKNALAKKLIASKNKRKAVNRYINNR